MKIKHGFIGIKATRIKYDLEFAEPGVSLPKTMTVEANDDYLACCVASDGFLWNGDEDEIAEYVGELVEEKTGVPVWSLDWRFK